MKKLLLCALVICTIGQRALADDDRKTGQQKIRDNAGNVIGYKERTVNNTRYRDANQKIILTIARDGDKTPKKACKP